MSRAHMEKSPRLYLLDALRGLCIISMMLYHLAYDINAFGIYPLGIGTPPFELWRITIAGGFCLISGISGNLSKNRFRRGFVVLLFAYAVTLATYLYNPRSFVMFGILHCLGFCMLIYAALKKYIDRLFSKFAPFVWLALFIVFLIIKFPRVDVPHLYMFGFFDASFRSSDYYPIIPWLFLFLFGTSLSGYVKGGRLPRAMYTVRIPALVFLGRHSLIIYLLHQPLFIGAIILIQSVGL